MEINISNEDQSSPNSNIKPYERKILKNPVTPKNFFTEENINNYRDEEDEKEIPKSTDKYNQSQNDNQYNYINVFKKSQNESSENLQNNFEYASQEKNSKNEDLDSEQNLQTKKFNENDSHKEDFSNKKEDDDLRYIKKDYKVRYIDEEYQNENNNELENYNSKFKYKKLEKDEQNVEYENISNNEKEITKSELKEEKIKEDDSAEDKIDLEEIKKKPGRILHQSVLETYDDEGNRVVTTKTIKEFSQTTGGFRIKNLHESKEKKEFERHTTSNIKKKNLKTKERKTNLSYKNRIKTNKGDKIYPLVQLAKIKNDSEKKKKIYTNSISPIIIHESTGYENQNSILSHEIIDPNSFDKDPYERSKYNYNYNYPTNYGRINLNNNNNNELDYEERYYYPSVGLNPNDDMKDEEYFIKYESSKNKNDILSPIGYIATYSSGSEDNDEIGKSYEQYPSHVNYTTNYMTANSKKGKNKNKRKYKKEGELIKEREIVYQMEDPNEYINSNISYNKDIRNLSGIEFKAQIDTSKSDKKDFQSPDRGYGTGTDKFKKVTMAMISSYGPTCEDRKITRKMRSEIGGVVDLRQELNPVNNYKIIKAKRLGFNLNKEVNPKTKNEAGKIIQFWWRMLKEKKMNRIKNYYIIKIQSVVRRFLIRNRLIESQKLYNLFEIIESIFNIHSLNYFFNRLKQINEDKMKMKLCSLINKLDTKNKNLNLIKYFFKFKFITNLLNRQNNYYEEKIETKIDEEMYINYIKEKYLKSNISEHTSEISIKDVPKKKETNEQGTGIFTFKEDIEKIENINYLKEKKQYKDSETTPIKNIMQITNNNLEIKSDSLNKILDKVEPIKNDDFNISKEKPELIIDKKEEYIILRNKKEYKDEESQKIIESKEQGINPIIVENRVIKNEFIQLLKNKKETAEKSTSMNIENKIISPKKISKNEQISYINKIIKKDKGQQIGSWKNIIKKNESIKIISKKPQKIVYNIIKRSESFKIPKTKKQYKDESIQYITEKNKIEKQEFEIKKKPLILKEESCQYTPVKSSICKTTSYSVLKYQEKPKPINYTIRKNSFSITKQKKILNEKGEQCELIKKIKNNEIIIGNHVQRESGKKLYELLRDIWIKKNLNKFIKNCRTKIKEDAIKKELMRTALLKWRFIKGYGGDKYGIIYDRDGKEIGKKEGSVKDISIQNILGDEINNSILRQKALQIKISQQKPLYIESNPKNMIDSGTGEGVNHTINEMIIKRINFAYKKKPKGINKISGKNSFKISKIEKKYKNVGTSMLRMSNKITNENRIFINNDKFRLIHNRKKELLARIINRNLLREKYKLNFCFLKWYKNAIKLIEQERKNKALNNKQKIYKNDKFEIIQKKEKRDKSCGNIYIPNKLERAIKIEFKNNKRKKDEGIQLLFPPYFKKENLKKSKINNDIYKSYKKPIILRQIKNESTTILGSNKNILTKNEINLRKTQILSKFVDKKITPDSLLRKYFLIWLRKSQYFALLNNAEIIINFCRSKLNQLKTNKTWKKLYKKYLLIQKQNNIMKILKRIKERKNKILQLIRITTLIRFSNQKNFFHKIIMYWFIYTINAVKKRNKMKILYENMLTTYVSMADDIFGKNQKNNPSIQDFMFEIVDTNKYQVKELEDVPMAKTYYSKKKSEKKIVTNIKYINRDIEEEKETIIYNKTKNYYYPNKFAENIKLNEKSINSDLKKENLSNKINLSFNYNDNSIFDENNKSNKRYNFNTSGKKYEFKRFHEKDNNNNNRVNDFYEKYKKGNSTYKSYNTSNNQDTNISFNKISINNNIYSNIINNGKDTELNKGSYYKNRSFINNVKIRDNNEGLNYNKYSPINKYNNNYNTNSSTKINTNKESRYIPNYYRRNINFSDYKKE